MSPVRISESESNSLLHCSKYFLDDLSLIHIYIAFPRRGIHSFLFCFLDRRFLGRVDGMEALAFGRFEQQRRGGDEDNLRGLEHIAGDDGGGQLQRCV